MKIVFFGSGSFAVKILETVHGSPHDVSLVVTQPDRKKGRHLRLSPTPVKDYASKHRLNIYQPENINTEEAKKSLLSQEAEIFLVVCYGRILSLEILKLPKKMCVNIHASLLPKYRGAAPINRVLMDGGKRTGISFIKMNERLDQGDILFYKALNIENSDNALTLDEKLKDLAAQNVLKVLNAIETEKVKFRKQDDRQATYAKLMKKEDGFIHWDHTSPQIFNSFRGCFGWPGSFTHYQGKLLKILKMEVGRHGKLGQSGEIISTNHNMMEVACFKGSILIHEVLPESHNRMSVASFLAGHKVSRGEMLEK